MDRSCEATLPALGAGAVNPAAVNGLPSYNSGSVPEGNKTLHYNMKMNDEIATEPSAMECSPLFSETSEPHEVILSSWEDKRKLFTNSDRERIQFSFLNTEFFLEQN